MSQTRLLRRTIIRGTKFVFVCVPVLIIGQQLWVSSHILVSQQLSNIAIDDVPETSTSSPRSDNGEIISYWIRVPKGEENTTITADATAVLRTIKRPSRDKEEVLVRQVTTSKRDFLRLLKRHFPGAKDPSFENHQDDGNDGNMSDPSLWNYVHDPTFIRKQNYPFTIPTDFDYVNVCAPPGDGPEGPDGYRVLTSKVRIAYNSTGHHGNRGGNTTSKHENANATMDAAPIVADSIVAAASEIKLFCALYTYEGGKERMDAIVETWGKRCDGFMGASTVTNQSAGVVNIYHEGMPGSYRSIWKKVRAVLAYIYQHYLDDYDYFHIMGDDVFLIVENLKAFLAQVSLSSPKANPLVYAGSWISQYPWVKYLPPRFYYAGGGPGYTISRSAVKAFVEKALLSCEDTDSKFSTSAEDFFMGWCFWEVLGIEVVDDIDERGEHRYHGNDAEFMYKWDGLKTVMGRFHRRQMSWQETHFQNHPIKRKMESVSAHSVAFHQVKQGAKLRRYEKLLYRKHHAKDCVCDNNSNEREPGYAIDEPLNGHSCEWNYREAAFINLDKCASWQTMKRSLLTSRRNCSSWSSVVSV